MSQCLLTTQGLRKEYFELLAVDDIDLMIPAGEIFGFIGPNGAGKTTTLRMLATTLEPTEGRILINGIDVWDHPTQARKQIGFMPDFFHLYEYLTVEETLEYFGRAYGLPRKNRRLRIDEVIQLIGLQEKRHQLVKGLSRGMMQRLGVGQAILHEPDLLLLDEPASGLDPLARQKLFDLLRNINAKGTTVVISSHILAELSALCTSVVIMDNGKIIESGRTDEITRRIIPLRRIRLRLAGGNDAAMRVLNEWGIVKDLDAQADNVRFSFDGDDHALAQLNARLVSEGAAIARLEEIQTDLNELYLKIAERSEHAPVL